MLQQAKVCVGKVMNVDYSRQGLRKFVPVSHLCSEFASRVQGLANSAKTGLQVMNTALRLLESVSCHLSAR